MLTKDRIVHQGDWLFRWRSYLPLFLIILMVPAIRQYQYFLDSQTCDFFWGIGCLCVSCFGFLIRCYTVGRVPKGTSGRNTKAGQIADSLNTTGIYSLVRNPLYVGNFFMMFGVILFLHDWELSLLFSIVFWVYYERIVCAEEEFLLHKFGDGYVSYVVQTPAFLPSFRNWKRSDMTFSWKSVMRREYCGLLGMVACFFVLRLITDAILFERLIFDPVWSILFLFALFIFLLLRSLKKYTKLLNVEGR